MGHLSTDALVLKSAPIGERDRLCTLLTAEQGVIRTFAKGVRSMKHRNFTATAQFAYGHFELFRGREAYTLDEAVYSELFVELRDDIEKLALAQYFCELAMDLAPEEMEAHDYLCVIRSALYYLAKSMRDPALLKSAVELRLLCLSGYQPDLLMCQGCGVYEAEVMYFIPGIGQLMCGECFAQMDKQPFALPLGAGALTALRHCCYADIGKLFAFRLPQPALGLLAQSSELFLLERLSRSFNTLEFYKQISNP